MGLFGRIARYAGRETVKSAKRTGRKLARKAGHVMFGPPKSVKVVRATRQRKTTRRRATKRR